MFTASSYDIGSCQLLACGTVADWVERSTCNVESRPTGRTSSETVTVQDLEQVLCTQLRCNITSSALPRRVSAILNLNVRRVISKVRCIVLY